MISKRLEKLVGNGSAVRAMFEEGNRLASIYGRENVYDFSIGNPNIPAPAKVAEAVKDIIDNEESTMVHGYMSNVGFADVRLAVAQSLNRRFGTSFTEKNIIMTVGAAGGLNVALMTLLDPGDEVLVFAPFFLEYGNYVNNFGGELNYIEADTDTFQPDVEALRAKISEKTKAIIINSPNNPSGVIYSEDTIKSIAAVLEEKQREFGHSIFIISDEPYRELAYDGAEVPYLTKYYRNTIVGYSWSKSLSLPGERIGYLVIPGEMDDFQLVFDAAAIANRILGFVNAPSLMQRVVMRCVDEKTDICAYDRNRRLLYNGLKDCGFECAYSQGAFYMWLKCPTQDDKKFCADAKEFNILIVPGSSFACPGFVRIAYCVSEKMIKNSLPAFKKLAEKYGLAKRG